MSGHSKWSTIKRQKASEDKKRGQAFTKLAQAITVAVVESGGNIDPSSNIRLRMAIDRAKQTNMPKVNIKRAIERGAGKNKAGNYNEVLYEGFGSGGVGILVVASTDNKNRTQSTVRSVFDRKSGHLVETGAVSHMFKNVGIITVKKNGMTYDEMLEIALEATVIDVVENSDVFILYTNPKDLHNVLSFLTKKNITVDICKLGFQPLNKITLNADDKKEKVQRLLDELEQLDDIQDVFTNAEF